MKKENIIKRRNIMRKLRTILLKKELSAEERALITANSNHLENVIIKIADKQRPMEKATYRFNRGKNRFIEQTGTSNYLPIYTPWQFAKALRDFDYQISVELA